MLLLICMFYLINVCQGQFIQKQKYIECFIIMLQVQQTKHKMMIIVCHMGMISVVI